MLLYRKNHATDLCFTNIGHVSTIFFKPFLRIIYKYIFAEIPIFRTGKPHTVYAACTHTARWQCKNVHDIIIVFDILKNILLSTQIPFDITVMFSPKLATVKV